MLPSLPNPELFFGLCSPIGTDNPKVVKFLGECLQRYSYEAEYFKVTELMKSIQIKDLTLKDHPIEARYDSYIKAASDFRVALHFGNAVLRRSTELQAREG